MDASTLFDRVRDLNIRALADTVLAYPNAHVEPTFSTDDGDVAVSGPFGLPCRSDVIPVSLGEAGETVMVTPKSLLGFEPLEIQCADGVPFDVSPFGWDYAHFSVSIASDVSLEPLLKWFWRWFDENDDKEPGPDGLYGVVHYLSDPEFEGDKLKFVVDFGSAPVEALNELVSVLVEMGARRLGVG